MPGPLQHYVYKVPLEDFMLGTNGQPKDLLQLVQEQEAMQQQQQQQGPAAAVQTLESTEGLGSLEDFLAPDGQQQAAAAAADSSISRSDQQADLAVLMPQLALTAQQLQVQLLQLLQSNHYSIPELQRRLMQQIDVAEAYYKAHIQGTPLEQLLLASRDAQQQPAAAAAKPQDADAEGDQDAADGGNGGGAAAAQPGFINYDLQRQAVQQLLGTLEPLLAAAGPQEERESRRLFVSLQRALEQHTGSPSAADAADTAEAAGGEEQQGLAELVAAADPATLVAAFNHLNIEQRQQLVDAVPDARITLNIQGTDLRAVLSASSSSSSINDASAASSSSSSRPAEWPGQVPTLVDVWGHQEVSRQQLAAVQQALPDLQGLLEGVDRLSTLTGAISSSSSSRMSAEDISAVQQAVNIYAGLLLHYDAVG
jgi:hypothetical protein